MGGGTAGCPLAATLSQNYSVLLLERGGSPYGNPNISHMQNFHISLADTSPSSANQAFISTDGVINARARVLGGGTCINAGFYTRASPRYVSFSVFLFFFAKMLASVIVTNDLDLILMYVSSFKSLMVFGMCVAGEGGLSRWSQDFAR